MRARKAMDLYGSRACTQDSGTIYLYPTKTKDVGHGLAVKEGVVLQWGEEGAYFRVPNQALLGDISCWDGILSKRGKHELQPLDACYRSW